MRSAIRVLFAAIFPFASIFPFAAMWIALSASAARAGVAEPQKKTQPVPLNAISMIPIKVAGQYASGELIELRVRGRMAYLVKPTHGVDAEKRWVWIFPFWLGINDWNGRLHHRFYVERMLGAGFHVAGIDVGTSCGSPTAAAVCQEFYELLTTRYGLNKRARLSVQSNGGLIGYGWAFRHPDSVKRIAGICPATDFRTWPQLHNVIAFPEKTLDYGLTEAELTRRIAEFNPIDNLAPLAKAGVKILHIHGDADPLVPIEPNALELARRYKKLGGSARIVVIKGLGHGGMVLYESRPFIDFLLAD